MSGTCKACNKVLLDNDISMYTVVDETGKSHRVMNELCGRCKRKMAKPDTEDEDLVEEVYSNHKWYVNWSMDDE